MNHTVISNPYSMEQVPKHRTPVEVQVNGKYAVCHRCGRVRVKVVKSFYLGKIPTKRVDANGSTVYEPAGIKLCSICNSVIQSPVPESKPQKVTDEDGKANPKIYALLALLINGEREGWKLAKMLEVSPPTIWTYLWELQREGLVEINKENRNARLSLVTVTEEGYHRFDAKTTHEAVEKV